MINLHGFLCSLARFRRSVERNSIPRFHYSSVIEERLIQHAALDNGCWKLFVPRRVRCSLGRSVALENPAERL